MYSDDQKRDHIKELQRLLYEISFFNKRIPLIIPDGIYGPETSGAVRIFQQEYGLSVTGNVDFETWEKLIQVYKFYMPDIIKPDIFKRDTVLIPGSAGNAVYMIQLMMNAIGRLYANIPVIAMTGVYDADTERSVDSFKDISGHDKKLEGIDVHLWNDIVSKFNKIL